MNNFILQLVAGLSKTKSKQQIKLDAKSLGDMYVKLIGNLDMPKTRKAIKAQLKGLNNLTFNITPNVNTKGVQTATKQAINNAQRVANSNKVHLNFDTSKQQLVNQIKILGRNNNKLFSDREMTAKYNQLLNSANVAKSTGELKTLRGELSAFKTELVATNNAGLTWGAKFKKSIESYAKFFSGASMIYALSNQVRNASTEAKTLDDSLVDLQKVTDEIGDRDALYKYFDKSLSKAQELNVKVGSLIDAVTEFKKLGWDLDDAELGAEWANILANVGDVDIETAISSIKTSIASFDEIGGYGNDQMDKKLEAYTDLINNMSNKYSIDAEGLAESIRLSAGTLTEAHMTIEQAATMFATANKYYNDPSYLGNTAKIGSLRMRASSGDTDAIVELQEMGEEVDDLATATSNLREKLMALTGVDIMENEHTFKSYYDQLYEIAQVMDQLDDTSRANVLETMFGKSRSAAGAAILSGMKESASAYEDAINSAGSATEEYQTWMTGADAACQRFSNTLTETYQSIINGNTVRDLANLGSAVLELANNWGIVEGTLKGVIALNLGKFIATGGMALITATKQVEQYGKALQMASNVPNSNLSARFQALKSIAQATSTLTTEQLRNVLATNTLTQADRVRILQMQGMTKEMGLQKLAEMNLTQATNAQTAANTASTASTFSLKAAMTGLGRTIQSVFLSNPVGIVLMGVSLGVSALTSYISKQNQALEEARQKAKEAADNANTLGDEIAELANKYIQLSDAVKTDATAKEDFMTTQTELLKKLGLEGESIDDLIAKYGSLSNAIKQASIDSLKNQQTDLIAGVNAAKEELMDVAKDNFWGTNNIISASGEEAVKAFKELEKAGVIDSGSYGTGGGQLVLIGDDTVEGALENYKKLEDAVNALRDSEAFTADELSDNSLFNSIYSRYSEMKESVEAYNSSIDNLNENLAQQTMLTALQGNELPKTEEDFNKFKQELIDTAVASKQFIGNEKEIATAIDNYLATVPEFEGYYSVPLENELNKVDELVEQTDFSIPDADTLKQQISDLNSAIDSIQSAYDTLTSACEEYNSNGGQLSIDTIQSLLSLSDEYLACLQVENGQLSLNADAMAQLAQAKLDDAQATAVTQAMTELQAIANGEAAQSTTNYITGNAALMSSLAQLSGSYDGVAQAAMTAAQAQELSAQISAASAKDKTATEKVMKGLDNKLKMIQITKKSISAGNFGTVAKKKSSSGSGSKSGSGSGNSAKDAEKEAEEYVDKYMSYQKAMLEGGKTDYQTYTKNVKSMLDDMYNSGKISARKYFSSVKDMIDEQKTIYEKALKAVTSRLEKEIDLWQAKIDALEKENDKLNDQKDTYDGILSAVQDVIDAETDRYQNLIDNLDKANDKLNKSKDDKDSILSAIADVYDEQIDALNKQSDALDEQIKKLQDANDELDKQYQKEKAIYALEQAQRLRNKKVYMDGKGYIYTQDQEAIRDAKKDLADIETDEAISKLEKEKEKLSDAIANLEKYKELWAEVSNAYEKETNKQLAIAQYGKDFEKIILLNRESDINAFKNSYIAIQKELDNNQSLIDSYNEKVEYYNKLKEQWSSISNAYDVNANKQAAIAQWGSGFEQMILSGRIQNINAFKDQYLAIQSQINNNEQLINSYNEKVDYYNKLKDQWGNTTSVYEDELNAQYAAQVLGAGWETNVLNGRLDVMRKFTNEYKALCQQQADYAINAANAEVTARNNANSGAMSGGSDVGSGVSGGSSAPISSGGKKTIAYIVVDLSGNQLYSSTNQTTAMNWIKHNGYVVSRTDNQKATTSVVYFYVRKNTRGGGGGNTMHVARYKDGGIVTASKGTLVTSYDNPLNVIAQSMGEDTMIAAKKGERILTPEQNEMWERWTKAMPKLMSYLPDIEYNLGKTNANELKGNNKTVNLNQNVTIQCPNVTNTNGAEYIVKFLRSASADALVYSKK